MSNHYHVVLHVNEARAADWSDREVAERWLQLYQGNLLVNRWLAKPEALGVAELEKVKESISEWRERLCSISWFMRGINEKIARMANEEDNCKGRFWEGRFKSQALLDEAAVLSCMTYVDLNPIRAGVEEDLMECDFTSIQQRLFDAVKYKKIKTISEKPLMERVDKQREVKRELGLAKLPEAPLMAFDGSSHTGIHTALPFTREDYFELVDITGRIIREDKSGYISASIPPIVARLGIQADKWIEHIRGFGQRYGYCVGNTKDISRYADRFHLAWCKGVGFSNEVYI